MTQSNPYATSGDPVAVPEYLSGTSGYPPTTQRPAPRPPLERRTKVGAAIAGAVSFVLLNLGFVLFWVPILLGILAVLFTTIVRFAARNGGSDDAGFRQFAQGVDSLQLEVWAVPLVLVSVVGLAIMVLAVFTSKWILAAREVARPWAITWSGLGIAIVANSVVGGVLSSGLNLVTPFATQGDDGRANWIAVIGIAGVVTTVLSIAVTAAIGWLAMWWMAFVFRPADVGQRD